MGRWIAWVIFGIVPGLLLWWHILNLRKDKEAEAGLFSLVLGVMIVVYGLGVGAVWCHFEWYGFDLLGSGGAMPFGPSGSPTLRDYWFTGWPIYLWCFVGLGVMVQGCFRLWRDYFDRSMQVQRRSLVAGVLLLSVASAVSSVWVYTAYMDYIDREEHAWTLAWDLSAKMQQLDRIQKGDAQAAAREAEVQLYGVAFEIDRRAKGHPLMPEECDALRRIAAYQSAHPADGTWSYEYLRQLTTILKRADS